MADDVRPWVKRLGSYLRIFGTRAGSPEYVSCLAAKAQKREVELSSKRPH